MIDKEEQVEDDYTCDDCHNYMDEDGCNCQGQDKICHEFRL
jgi:hypothetical protein